MRILIGLLILVFANTSAPFSKALSTTQERKSFIVTGTEAPDFTLKDQHGRQINCESPEDPFTCFLSRLLVRSAPGSWGCDRS